MQPVRKSLALLKVPRKWETTTNSGLGFSCLGTSKRGRASQATLLLYINGLSRRQITSFLDHIIHIQKTSNDLLNFLAIMFGLCASEPIDWVCHQTCPNGLPGVLPKVFGSGLTIPYYFLFNYVDFITNCSKICSCALLMPVSHPLSGSNNS
jgi:hypothetical protein